MTRSQIHTHATFAVTLTAMSLHRGAEVYWMHQKVQFSISSPTTASLTWILQFLSPFLLSQKCSSFLVRSPLCKHFIIKKSHLYSPLCCLRLLTCFSSSTHWSPGLGLTLIHNYYCIALFLLYTSEVAQPAGLSVFNTFYLCVRVESSFTR